MVEETEKLAALRLALGKSQGLEIDGLSRILTSMKGVSPDRESPVREIPARLGDRWSALLLMVLETGTYRHAELKRVVSILSSEQSISQRMLTLRLRALERDGFVRREVYDSVSPRVDYSLTPLGQELTERFVALIRWIEENNDQVLCARALFEDGVSS